MIILLVYFFFFTCKHLLLPTCREAIFFAFEAFEIDKNKKINIMCIKRNNNIKQNLQIFFNTYPKINIFVTSVYIKKLDSKL